MSTNKISLIDFIGGTLASRMAVVRFGRWIALLQLAYEVRRERDQLAKLSPSQLADMGIHPGDAKREVERDFFDLPKSRLDRLQ